MSRANPAWHRGYDEGQAAADQELAVCAPPDEYDSNDATEFMAGWHTGLRHGRWVLGPEPVVLLEVAGPAHHVRITGWLWWPKSLEGFRFGGFASPMPSAEAGRPGLETWAFR